MKVVAIMGSPHGMEGATGQLLQSTLDGIKDAGGGVQTFLLQQMEMRPCQACDVCHISGECAIVDGYRDIKRALLGADGIVIASPNYISSVSAQTKAMMDRCCGLLHTHALDGKYGAAVVTSGGEESGAIEQYILRFLRSLGCWTVGSCGAAAWQMQEEDGKNKMLTRAKELGRTLVESIEKKTTFPDQEPEKRAFRERMKQLVMARGEEWEYEYRYWQRAKN